MRFYSPEDHVRHFIDKDTFRGYLFAICRKYLSSDDAIRDAIQDIYVKIWRNRSKFKCSSQIPDDPKVIDEFRKWIAVIAKNHCIELLRSRQRRNEHETPIDDFERQDRGYNPFLDRVKNHAFEDCLNQLEATDPNAFEVFMLIKGVKFSRQEVADAVGRELTQVDVDLARAKRRLIACYEKKKKKAAD